MLFFKCLSCVCVDERVQFASCGGRPGLRVRLSLRQASAASMTTRASTRFLHAGAVSDSATKWSRQPEIWYSLYLKEHHLLHDIWTQRRGEENDFFLEMVRRYYPPAFLRSNEVRHFSITNASRPYSLVWCFWSSLLQQNCYAHFIDCFVDFPPQNLIPRFGLSHHKHIP